MDIFKEFVNIPHLENRSEEGKESAKKFALKILDNILTEKIAEVCQNKLLVYPRKYIDGSSSMV